MIRRTKPSYRDAEFAAAVRRVRTSRGWTQDVFALELGVSIATVSRMEAHGVVPSDRVRIRIRDLLGVESEARAGLIDGTTRYEDDYVCRVAVATLGPCTLDTIGVLMGLSKERVRQIEAGAVRKLKRHLGERGWFKALADLAHRDGATLASALSPWTGER